METKNTDRIKAIAFDLGRVLFDFDFMAGLDKIKDRMTLPPEKIIDAMLKEHFTDDFERGLISPEEFFRRFKAKTGLRLSYDDFVPVWCDIFTLKEDTLHLVRSLKPDYKLLLISNINELHWRFLAERFPEVFALFDELILSFEVKEIKPSPKIYDILLAKARCTREELVYIDDRADLVGPAREQGLQAIRFESAQQCSKELEAFGCVALSS